MGPFGWRRSGAFLGILALSIAPAAHQVSARGALGTRMREASVPANGGGPGTVVSELEISNTTGGLPDTLDYGDQFGTAIAALGDLDGDGVEDVAIAAPSQTVQFARRNCDEAGARDRDAALADIVAAPSDD